MKYLSTQRNQNAASYVQLEPTFAGTELQLSSTNTKPKIDGKSVSMVKGYARVFSKTTVEDACEPGCGVPVNNMVEIRFNCVEGDVTTFNSLLAEASRVTGIAQTNYAFAHGILPPATADFAD